MDQWWHIVNWTLRDKSQCNLNKWKVIKENPFENVVCKCQPFCSELNVLISLRYDISPLLFFSSTIHVPTPFLQLIVVVFCWWFRVRVKSTTWPWVRTPLQFSVALWCLCQQERCWIWRLLQKSFLCLERIVHCRVLFIGSSHMFLNSNSKTFYCHTKTYTKYVEHIPCFSWNFCAVA